jgi:DNA-binding transcriptional regulator GbsR (MarR family)
VAAFCAEQYGMPPITGRILGWLMICDPAEQSAAEIAEAIGASRASLTTNMRLLTVGEYVRRTTRPGERTSYYRIDSDAWRRAVRRKLASLESFRDITGDGLGLLGADSPRADRIRSAHETFEWLAGLLDD